MSTTRASKLGQVQRSKHDELAAAVLRQFRQVFNAVKTHFQQVEKTVGLGGAQVWALSVIRDHPGIRVTELAQAMDIHQSTASNLAKGLIDRDLIMSLVKEDPDKRIVRLKLKPAGSKVLRAVPGPFEGVLPNALHSMDAATLKRMHTDLNTLLAELHADAEAAHVLISDM